MKKVLITESQLRTMVRKMLMEQTAMGSTPVGSTGFQTNTSLGTDVAKVDRTINSNKIMQQNLSLIDKGVEGGQLIADILSRTNLKKDPTAKTYLINVVNNYFKS